MPTVDRTPARVKSCRHSETGSGLVAVLRWLRYGDTICKWLSSKRTTQLGRAMSGTVFPMVSPHFARVSGLAGRRPEFSVLGSAFCVPS